MWRARRVECVDLAGRRRMEPSRAQRRECDGSRIAINLTVFLPLRAFLKINLAKPVALLTFVQESEFD